MTIRSGSRRVVGVGLMLALGVCTTACRQPDRLDMGRAGRRIAAALTATYHLPVDRVRCPDRVKVKRGATFACTVRIDGKPLTVRVSQRNDNGDLRVEASSAVLVMAEVRADMKETLATQLKKKNLKAGCGSARVRVVPPGETFECKVSDGKTERVVTVRVRDAKGNLTYTVKE